MVESQWGTLCGKLPHDSTSENERVLYEADFQDIIHTLRQLPAKIPETVFLSPTLLHQTEEKIIDDILAILNKHSMDASQSLEFTHTGRTHN